MQKPCPGCGQEDFITLGCPVCWPPEYENPQAKAILIPDSLLEALRQAGDEEC